MSNPNSSDHERKLHAKLELERAQAKIREDQLKWIKKRSEMRARADNDPEAQALLIYLCKHDIIFFFNYFVWTYDPRTIERWVPFIVYPYQGEILLWLLANIMATMNSIERRNLLIEKSRDMGVSWIVCGFMLWALLFMNWNFIIGSRKEEEVDKKGDLDTPFQKIREMYYRLPYWLQINGFNERDHDKFLCFINPQGGQIVGESATHNFARGGRNTMAVFDEQQAWPKEVDEAAYTSAAQSTQVRLSIGTANGTDNMFYLLRSQKKGAVDVKTLHWRLHPVKGAGAHLNSENQWTSPWYEEQSRTMPPEDVAAEIDIKYDRSQRGIIFKTYVPDQHGKPKVEAMPRGVIVRSFDPGQRYYFVLWTQFDEYGRALVLRELCAENARLRDVGRSVIEISEQLQRDYPYYSFRFEDVGDPQGATRTGAGVDHPDYTTLAQEFGIHVNYQFIQSIPSIQREKLRIQAIRNCLNDYIAEARTMQLQVDIEQCPKTHAALMGGYRFKTDKIGAALPGDIVEENRPANDAIDCLGYQILWKWGGVVQRASTTNFEVEQNSFQWPGLLKRRAG